LEAGKPQQFESVTSSQVPPILADSAPHQYEERNYSPSWELLPQYVFPVWLISDSSTVLGAATGSQDPIGRHIWNAFAYHYWQAQRPGGSLRYRYRGLGFADLDLQGFAGISQIGSIYIRKDPAEGESAFLPNLFYERSYGASASLSHWIWKDNKATPFLVNGGLFFEHRRPLLSIPQNAIRTDADLESSYPGVTGQVLPEKGNQAGVFGGLQWSLGGRQHPRGISPLSGHQGQLNFRYSPKFGASDIESFITSLSTQSYWGSESQGLAFQKSLGIQWLDPLFQSSFRLGGSTGGLDLPSLRIRSYPLRGLGVGALRGEGVLSSSLEYRFRLASALPGFGTAPIWFQNLHAAFFSDLGQAFQHQKRASVIGQNLESFSFSRMTLSGGAELRSNISVYYAPPITFRLGYAQIFLLQGRSYWQRDWHQVYFQIGQNF
jgi:hypothetical protein